ncbi:putative photosynthetic complex assembly protein PuhE [Pseudorhodoplanes sp.]|uniref:putative photosynthetic complex assembly protein PuhE n=1 Tax=Pseudorhodoplanes sp. TaxID=1934341 RepID=UPI00391BC48B
MIELAIPALYALLVWWLSTGIVLYIARLPARMHPASLAAGAGLAIAALAAIAFSARMASPAGAYIAFTAAIVFWGFIELTFLTGAVLGSNRSDMPPATGWTRLSRAIAAINHHELALLLGGVFLLAVSYAAPNQIALWTYAVLWLMRISAKLNLFFGVPNLHDELLPERLAHLRSHFRRGPANPLLPVSIILTTFAAGYLAYAAMAQSGDAFAVTSLTLVAALLALAAIEHVFMLIPLPVMMLWNWRKRARAAQRPDAAIETVSTCRRSNAGPAITRRGS